MAGSYATFELDDFPVVRVRVAAKSTPDGVQKFFDDYGAICSGGRRCALLVDMRTLDPSAWDARARQETSRLMLLHSELFRSVTICEARLVSNSIIAGALTAYDWVARTQWPVANFTNEADARAWIDERMAADPAPVPATSSSRLARSVADRQATPSTSRRAR